DQDVLYAGFVEDIKLYFDAADVFINPVTDGGGIKTKLIEALAANARAVSYASGAIGVDAFLTGGNMKIVDDGNAAAFVNVLLEMLARQKAEIPAAFFDHFNWRFITRKAAEAIEKLL
ncbi:MAG: glycosyltransferase family 4 protein, partial [Niabella sp.]|nr:glycosyltransferase family 4 protein [Niabella sp.]